MPDLFELDYFSIVDIAWAILAIVIFMLIVNIQKKKHRELDYAEYYTANVWLKIALGLVYAVYYITIVKGGDTLAYWDGALKMQNLFFKDPNMYFEELFNTPDLNMFYRHFDINTGLPPGWIYREPDSWFISKIMSVLSFVSIKSYLVATLILAYISSIASWKLFELVYSFGLHTKRNIAIAVVLMPSVSFWCSGVTKDTIVLFSTIFIVYHGFHILSLDKETKLKNWIALIIFSFLLYHIRSFMLATIFLPMALSYTVRLVNKHRKNKFKFYMIRFSSFTMGILFFVFQGNQLANSKQLEDAAALNKDFATNKTYEGTRYNIGITEYNAQGMIKVMPAAIIAGMYRPFPWEARTLTMIANGLEDTFFIYLTFLFFSKGFLKKVSMIRRSEFLVFAFFFAVLMAYMAGVTSGLLGVLVRFKAPVIPFLVLILTVEKKSLTEMTNKEIVDEE